MRAGALLRCVAAAQFWAVSPPVSAPGRPGTLLPSATAAGFRTLPFGTGGAAAEHSEPPSSRAAWLSPAFCAGVLGALAVQGVYTSTVSAGRAAAGRPRVERAALLSAPAPGALRAPFTARGKPRHAFVRAAVTSPEAELEAQTAATEAKKASFDTSIDTIPKCPLTRWDSDSIDFSNLSQETREIPLEMRADAGTSEEDWVVQNKESILEQLEKNGAIWLRGMELPKTKTGFAKFYELLGLEPCQDPLASVGARAVVSKKGAIYEAVNKPSRAKFFVGMHNESTYKRTNRLGAFVCFKQAETGGEFLLLDGQKVLREMDPDVRQRMYERGVRFSNAELPFFDFLRSAGPLKEVLQPFFKGAASVAVGQKIDMELELRWDENEKDGLRLQAWSPPQSPVNRHPSTGEPSWFCNLHSHSRYLRDGRDGELAETTGASKLNVTDIFYGDGTPIPAEDLDHLNDIYMKNLVHVPMSEGDVVLVDNYQVMHGRDVFTGERLHAVTWFQ